MKVLRKGPGLALIASIIRRDASPVPYGLYGLVDLVRLPLDSAREIV